MKAKLLVLVAALVTLGMVASAHAQGYPSGMISYWKLDDGSGTVAVDALGVNNGSVVNPDWKAGCVVGGCIQSSPRGATYVSVPNSPSLNTNGNAMTVEGWVYPLGSSHLEGQGNFGTVAGTDAYAIGVGGWWRGVFEFFLATEENGMVSANSQEDFPAQAWYHMAGVYDGSQLKLYVNGQLNTSIAQHGKIAPFTSPLTIGRPCGGDSGIDGCLYGKADEVAVYNRALSADEIVQHYQNGLAGRGYGEVYDWSGFLRPIANPPKVNRVKAGVIVPVRFRLGGFHGLDIFAAGYPQSQPVDCKALDPRAEEDVNETVTPGRSFLLYNPFLKVYDYVWKTDRSWAGTCRQFVVRLTDGTEHTAAFNFK